MSTIIQSGMLQLNRPQTSRVILLMAFLNALFWITTRITNVYANGIAGAVFEILWLPALLLLLLVPLLSIAGWIKQNCRFTSRYFYSLLLFIITCLIIWKY